MPKDILERRGGLICRSDLELHKVRLFRVAFGTSHWDMSNVNLLRYRDNEERESIDGHDDDGPFVLSTFFQASLPPNTSSTSLRFKCVRIEI